MKRFSQVIRLQPGVFETYKQYPLNRSKYVILELK